MSIRIARASKCVLTLTMLMVLAGSGAALARNSRSSTEPVTAAVASPCENADMTPETRNIPFVEQSTLCLVNQARARHNLSALLPNADLQETAAGHNEDMIAHQYFAQTSPSGLTLLARVRLSGYLPDDASDCLVGQDIAWGTGYLSTPAAIVSSWIDSPAVLANILQAYTSTGVAVSPQAPVSSSGGQLGATYTQDFGAIAHARTPRPASRHVGR